MADPLSTDPAAPPPSAPVAARGRAADETPGTHARRPPIERWLDARVIAAGVVVTAVRFWFAVDRRVFHVVADEPGQLAMARWLAGGTRWNMFDHSTWRPGYSLLLAPTYWFVDTGEGVVRAALTVNALLAGASAMVLTRLLVRWTAAWRTPAGQPVVGSWTAAAIATATALAPAAIAASAYTWAEAMVTCTFLVTLWWVQRFADSAQLGHALAATFAAAVSMTTHGRSLAILPTVVVIGAGLLLVHRRWIAATAIVGYGVVLGLASLAFTDRVHDAVWDDPSEINTPGSVIERLDAPLALAESFIGQAWYQLVASAGLVGIGAGVVLWSLVRPAGRLDRRSAGLLIALTSPLVLTSVTFMSDRDRSDQLVYGRYVDAVIWPVAAIGAATVVRFVVDRRRGPAAVGPGTPLVLTVAALAGTFGLVIAWRHGDQLASDIGLRMMVPGLLPYIGGTDGVPVLRITAVAVVVLAGVGVLARRGLGRRGAIAATLAVALALGWSGMRVHDAQAHALNTWAIGDAVARIDAIVPDGASIGVLMVSDSENPRVPYGTQRQRYQVYQLYLLDREIVWERTPPRFTADFVLAPAGTDALVAAGGRVRWGDPTARMALWELPERSGGAGRRVPSSG